jgi:hypothetical protein
MNKRAQQLWWVLLIVWTLAVSGAEAQEGPPPPAEAPPTAATTSVAPAPSPAQLGAMLGGAEFMLILDRPFAAEKLFNAVLSMDPKNAHALDGLRRVKLAKRTSWTFLAHGYADNLDTQMETWGGGPSFYTSLGKVTFWVGDGIFRSFGPSLQKITVNGIWEPYYKNFDGYAYINRTFYPDAPDRTLFNFKGTWNRKPGREYYSVFGGQHDSYLQTDLAQFFAPETLAQVKEKILNRDVGASAQIALGKHIDFIPAFAEFYYTACQENCATFGNFPSNQRRIAQGQVMYRVLPHGEAQMPIFRVGASYLSDSCDMPGGSATALYYFCPVNFHAVSVNADYVFVTGKYRYGVFGSYPVTGRTGTDGGRFDPARTLFSFVNYKVTESQELWLKFTGVHSSNYSPRLWDIVVGTNVRF